jgi:hypothetical protein
MIGRIPDSQGPEKINDSGILSLDFLVGLSFFLIAFIIVATMTSGLLIGLQSHTIDYDAVAYRTGVILIEDPGEIQELVGLSSIAPDRYAWDLLYEDYYDQYRESNVLRMGLMLPRYYYDTPPHVLMSHKISEFFNTTNFNRGYYRNKIIFGDYPYSFNISLIMRNDDDTSWLPPQFIGDPVPAEYSVGYIRRIGLVKNSTSLNILDMFKEDAQGFLTISYDFRNISDKNPPYMIYPSLEQTVINLTNFTDPNAILSSLQVCSPTCEDPEPNSPTILLKNYDDPTYEKRFPDIGVGMNEPVNNSTYIVIEPGYFSRRYFPNIGPIDKIDIRMQFRYENGTVIDDLGGDYDYDYDLPSIWNPTSLTQKDLVPAIIEVRVW